MNLILSLPALLLMAFVFGWPMLRYSWLSLHASSVLTGLEPIPNQGANWIRLLEDPRFWQDAAQTMRFAGVSVGLEILLALAMALLLDQRWRGRGVVQDCALPEFRQLSKQRGPFSFVAPPNSVNAQSRGGH